MKLVTATTSVAIAVCVLLANSHHQQADGFDQFFTYLRVGGMAGLATICCIIAIQSIIREELERKDSRER